MKRCITIFISAFLAVCFCSGCVHKRTAQEVVDGFDQLVSQIGQMQITKSESLIGIRNCMDAYTGDYNTSCGGITGREVIFGGASVKERTITLFGVVHTISGTVKIGVRQNWEIHVCTPEKDGTFSMMVTFSGGGNYVLIDYNDFEGEVYLQSVYEGESE